LETNDNLHGAPVRPRVGICDRVLFGFNGSKGELMKVNTLDMFPCGIAMVSGLSSATKVKIGSIRVQV
jgi:hypothetical protein